MNQHLNLFLQKYIPQYKDKNRYPYFCDFYLPELDIFIEINIYPAHGPHPYNANNEDDQNIIKNWLKLANEGKHIYIDWINRWTIYDVNKRNTAILNNLNYYELYNLDEIDSFIHNILKLNHINIHDIYRNL